MLVIDIILLVILVGFFIRGWQAGLLKTIGSFVGIILGIFLAGQYFDEAGAWLVQWLHTSINLGNILGYATVFLIVNIIINIIVWALTGILKIIPLFGTSNRLFGAIVSLVGGIFTLGVFIIMLDKFPLTASLLPWLEQSQVAPLLAQIASILMPLLPEALEQIKGVLPI